jgi:broad specificity phosphatase PhoE
VTLVLVRHGESTWNREGLIQGQTLTPALTALGLEQAAQVAADLVASGARRILSSDAVRARQTAEIIGTALRLPVEPTPLLRERHWGVFQGGPRDVARDAEAGLRPDQPLEGGESRVDVRRRARALLGCLDERPTVVVTHGGFITEALTVLGVDAPPEVANCSVTTVARPRRALTAQVPAP